MKAYNVFIIFSISAIIFLQCASDGKIESPTPFYDFLPSKLGSWWKMYTNNSFNYSRPTMSYLKDKGDGVTLTIKGDVNNTDIGLGIMRDTKEDDGDCSESGLNWNMVADITNKIAVEEMPQPGKEITKNGGDGKNQGSSLLNKPELNLARRIVSLLPPFIPSSSNRVTNEQCIKDSRYYLQELDNFALWALKMHDASAKLPSGLLNGNVNQYGDIDQCMNIKTSWQGGVIKGRYCLATMTLHLSHPDRAVLEHVHQLIMSYGIFKSELDDPGHRVPRFSSIHWGLCVPASCNASDVQIALTDTLQKYSEGTGITFRVRVSPEMCQLKDDKLNIPTSTFIVGGVFCMIVAFAILATIFDPEWKMAEQKLSTGRKLAQAFSLRKNVLTLVSLSRTADDIESIHGVRAINALMLLLAHKSMALFFNPYLDRTNLAKMLGKPWTSFARGACIYTDPFIMISGLLTSYSFYKQLEKKKKLDIPYEYISRLTRLMPNLVALILFCTFILPWIGSGPLWNQVVGHHSTLCKVAWWRNMLFIHNYFGFEKMCLTHTHHLGIDTQLFVLSPIFVYAIWRWPRVGLSALTGVAAISTALRYNVTYSKQLSHFIVFGSSMTQLFKTADLSYTLPAHRATVYVIGIALGFGLHYFGRDFKLKKMHLTLGWSAAILCFYFSIISPAHMADRNYVYNPTDAANFAAFAPVSWCLFWAWLIFISFIGYGGLLGQVLSWRGFLVTTRLSYPLYLIQFPVFFYTVGRNRVAQIYSVFLLVDVPEIALLIIVTVLLTLLFDLPFQNIRRILLKKPKYSR